jgi:hypothetical protein
MAQCKETMSVRERAVIEFLTAQNFQLFGIHRRMQVAYGDDCLHISRLLFYVGLQTLDVSVWIKSSFARNHEQLPTKITEIAFDEMIKENRRVLANKMPFHLTASRR